MSALTLQVAADLVAAHIGFVTGSIAREPALPFRPLAKLPEIFNGVNAQADAQVRRHNPARRSGLALCQNTPEISTGHPTHPQRTDAQPTAGGIPSPANPYQRAGVAGGDSQ